MDYGIQMERRADGAVIGALRLVVCKERNMRLDGHGRPGVLAAAAAVTVALCAMAGCTPAQSGGKVLAKRIVFLGDSITDGFTYPMLVRQALAEARKPPAIFINAGIGGDTAAGMRKRLDRDVLVHNASLVALSVGVNDVLRNVPPASYEADVRAIMERMEREQVAVLVMTTSILGPKQAEADRRLEGYNAVLRRLAEEFRHTVADVNGLMQAARKKGDKLLEADDVHPNFQGHRVMARAVLDALGCGDVPVPAALTVEPMPGLVTSWRLKAVKADGDPPPAMDEAAAAAVTPDGSWAALALPEQEAQADWWRDQVRRNGYAISVEKQAGKAKRYVGFATILAERPRRAYFNTGGHLQTIWLNGKRIYKSEGWTGYHAGKERVPAMLQQGANRVVIETGGEFFLSVTDNNTW
jgi:acyl-CoA thioesterase-1